VIKIPVPNADKPTMGFRLFFVSLFFVLAISSAWALDLSEHCSRLLTSGKQFDAQNGVIYLSPEQRKDYLLHIENGQLDFAKSGPLIFSKGLPRSKKVLLIFVIDQQGLIYLSDRVFETGVFHHSSLVAGDQVRAAGTLEISQADGPWKIVEISNESGHYHPEPWTIQNAIDAFKQNSLKFDEQSVDVTFNGTDTAALTVSELDGKLLLTDHHYYELFLRLLSDPHTSATERARLLSSWILRRITTRDPSELATDTYFKLKALAGFPLNEQNELLHRFIAETHFENELKPNRQYQEVMFTGLSSRRYRETDPAVQALLDQLIKRIEVLRR
jgi:hypothetical protein